MKIRRGRFHGSKSAMNKFITDIRPKRSKSRTKTELPRPDS